MESIWIEVLVKSQKLIFNCIYRPPTDKSFLKNFRKTVNKVCHRGNVILIGDFNIDMNLTKTPRNPSTNELLLLLNECNMQNVITSHTRITDHSKTLIDLAITGNPSKITNSGTHATGISDHDFYGCLFVSKFNGFLLYSTGLLFIFNRIFIYIQQGFIYIQRVFVFIQRVVSFF